MKLKPLVKWTGGKRRLLKHIIPMIPSKINTYVEPFIGGGAVFFDLQPSRAIINDFNPELINFYNMVKEDPQGLLDAVRRYLPKSSREEYLIIRGMDRNEDYFNLNNVEKAGRFYYLIRTSFNGKYTLNKDGYFNNSYGVTASKKHDPKIDEPILWGISKYFNEQDITIMNGDYKKTLEGLKSGDFVYFDPPYPGEDTTKSTINYTVGGFSEADQHELKAECDKLTDNGVKFLLSNSNHPLIFELYEGYNMKIVDIRYDVGGGAVLFDILNTYDMEEVYISDINKELIITYQIVRDRCEELIKCLVELQAEFLALDYQGRRDHFFINRGQYNKAIREGTDHLWIATLFIYLNKTCFNGYYKVNLKGEYNVPPGASKDYLICDVEGLRNTSLKLQNVKIVHGTYRDSLDFIDKNTFVYCDPPYRPLASVDGGRGYTKVPFNDDNQRDLAEYYKEVSNKGAKILLSNSDPTNYGVIDPFFDNLYAEYNIVRTMAPRAINYRRRGKVSELLIKNWEVEQ